MYNIVNIETLPDVFRVESIISLSRGRVTRRSLSYAIARLLREKKLVKVKNGTYSKASDPFYVSTMVYDGYIGLSSALFLRGLKTEVEADIYVCTGRGQHKATRFMDKTITPVNMSRQFYGASTVNRDGRDILVSTYPKTIFDMLSKPSYANYFDMYRAMKLTPLSKSEWKYLSYYLCNSSTSDIRRAGHATDGIAPQWFTKKLKRLSDAKTGVSFFFKHRAVNYSPRWKIYDDIGITRWNNAI